MSPDKKEIDEAVKKALSISALLKSSVNMAKVNIGGKGGSRAASSAGGRKRKPDDDLPPGGKQKKGGAAAAKAE